MLQNENNEDINKEDLKRGFLKFRFDKSDADATRIKVIGVGGGGCNAVSYMYDQKGELPGVSYLLCNTDIQALVNSNVPDKIVLGPDITRGLGAGNRPEIAEKAAQESAEDIKNKLIEGKTVMTIVTAGMGGGTGTGAAAVIGGISRELGILTVGIVTIPFKFEGRKKILQALKGVENFKKNVDAILIINNERIIEMYPDLSIINGFEHSDEVLADATNSICKITSKNGNINLDFRDIESTIKNGGVAVINTGYSSDGKDRLKRAIESALHSPLLNNNNIMDAKNVLVNLYCNSGEGVYTMEELSYMTGLSDTFNKIDGKNFIWGYTIDDSLEGYNIGVTILASGFDFDSTMQDIDTEARNQDDKLIQSYYKDIETTNMTQPLILSITELDDDDILQYVDAIALKRNISNIEVIRSDKNENDSRRHIEDIKIELEYTETKI